MVAEIAGEAVAQTIQLGIEYDPAPPFDAGHPDRAPEAVKAALAGRYEASRRAYREGLERSFASSRR
jgi:cyclohexyl-isocyanide hydratase